MRPGANRKYTSGNQGVSLAKHIFIPGTIRVNRMVPMLMKNMGDTHHSRYLYQFDSATVLGNNPVSIALLPLRDGAARWGSFSAVSSWGLGSWTSTYPNDFERVFLISLKIRIVITQFQENAKYRIALARMKNGQPATGIGTENPATYNPRTNWGITPNTIDEPNTQDGWTVRWDHQSRFDQPLDNSGTALRSIRTKELYIPFNRMLQTATKQKSTRELDWTIGTNDSDFTFLHFDTDDLSSADSEYLGFKVFFEWKWCAFN